MIDHRRVISGHPSVISDHPSVISGHPPVISDHPSYIRSILVASRIPYRGRTRAARNNLMRESRPNVCDASPVSSLIKGTPLKVACQHRHMGVSPPGYIRLLQHFLFSFSEKKLYFFRM